MEPCSQSLAVQQGTPYCRQMCIQCGHCWSRDRVKLILPAKVSNGVILLSHTISSPSGTILCNLLQSFWRRGLHSLGLYHLPFHHVGIWADGNKATLCKPAGALVRIKTVEPNSARSHCVLTTNTPWERPVLLKMSLMKQEEVLNYFQVKALQLYSIT